MKHYIFGYGTLINSESRAMTGKTGEAFTARFLNTKRGWYKKDPRRHHTAVGIVDFPGTHCHGVLVEISEEELARFDERENGYQRKEVSWSQIQIDKNHFLPRGVVWTYYPFKIEQPDFYFPIAQTYLDIILRGCLTISREFAVKFLQETENWGFCENDRRNPRYRRAVNSTDSIQLIDDILQNNLPEWFLEFRTEHTQ